MKKRFLILGLVLIILVLFSLATFKFLAPFFSKQQLNIPAIENCVWVETGATMSFTQAKEIALKSECVKSGSLKETHFCNESSGTWWIDLEIQKEGCAPACVIDVTSQQTEINWRCTGAKFATPSENQKILCQNPRPEACTMECVAQPSYICGSDGKFYCNKCTACANPKVEWYLFQETPCEE